MSSGPRSQGSHLAKLFVILALIGLVAAACGGGKSDKGDENSDGGIVKSDDEDTTTKAKDGGSVTFGVEAESTGWQPCVDSHSESGTTVMHSIYDPIAARTEDGKVIPYLAETITPNATSTEWVVKMRSGVKFSDGTPLDSAAVKNYYDKAAAPTSRCVSAVAIIQEVQVVDDLTVKFVLKSPFGPFAESLTGVYIFSPTNAEAKGPDVSANPVGTGPFTLAAWERDSKLTLKKNPTYWQKGLPHLDEVIIKPIPDEDARLASLSSGEVDMMFTLRQQYVRQARDLGDSFKRYEFIGNNSGGSIFNTALAPVDDKRVRAGLAHAVNQPDLIKILGGEGITPETTQFFSKDSPWYSEKVAKAYPKFDVAAGKKLIDEYKNDPARSDKQPVGSPVKVQFNCPPDPTLVAVAQGYQQMAKAVGVEMDLKQVEQATHIGNAVGKPPYTAADYMINCWRLGGQGDPDSILFNQYGVVEGAAANVTNFTSPKVQELLKTGRESSDFDARYKAYEELGLLFDEEVPHIWTGSTAASTVAKPELKNVASNWVYPDGKSKGKSEQSFIRFAYVFLDK